MARSTARAPACNAAAELVTKVTTASAACNAAPMSSAERVRRHRARKKIAAQAEELTFVRHDWALFLDPYRLPQKAGCPSKSGARAGSEGADR